MVPRDAGCENHSPRTHGIPRIRSAGETLEYCAQTRAVVQFFFFRTHDRTPRKKKGKKEKEKRLRDGAAAGVEIDAEEAPSGELGCEQPEPPDDR